MVHFVYVGIELTEIELIHLFGKDINEYVINKLEKYYIKDLQQCKKFTLQKEEEFDNFLINFENNNNLHNLDFYINLKKYELSEELYEFIQEQLYYALYENSDINTIFMDYKSVVGYEIKPEKYKCITLSQIDYKQKVIKLQDDFYNTRIKPIKDTLNLTININNIIIKYVDIDITKKKIDVFIY